LACSKAAGVWLHAAPEKPRLPATHQYISTAKQQPALNLIAPFTLHNTCVTSRLRPSLACRHFVCNTVLQTTSCWNMVSKLYERMHLQNSCIELKQKEAATNNQHTRYATFAPPCSTDANSDPSAEALVTYIILFLYNARTLS
jgi:hypothetical protein